MEKINYTEMLEENKNAGFVFYDIGNVHNNMNNFLTDAQETILYTKDKIYKNIYNEDNYIIDLDDVWNFLNFSQKSRAKSLLEKNFIIDVDYKIINCNEPKKGKGGHNKEIIMMTTKTFNLLSLKSNTQMGNNIQ